MPKNLSFKNEKSTGNFYSTIHTEMGSKAKKSLNPPTSVEFSKWFDNEYSSFDEKFSVLDAGCGLNAFNARHCLIRKVENVHALDINTEAIEHLRSLHPNILCEEGSLHDIPYNDNSFDLVICSGVVHHTVNPDRALSEIYRVLKPGGKAWISLYCFRGSLFEYVIRSLRFMGKIVPYKLVHFLFGKIQFVNNFINDHAYVPILWIYDRDDAIQKLRVAGFDITEDWASSIDFFQKNKNGALISGDGLIRAFICAKREAL